MDTPRHSSITEKFEMDEAEKSRQLEKIRKLEEKIKFLETQPINEDRMKPEAQATRKRSLTVNAKNRSLSESRVRSEIMDDRRPIFQMKKELDKLKMEFLIICSDEEVRKIRRFVEFSNEPDIDIGELMCSICKTKCENDPKRCFAEVKQRIEKTKNYPTSSEGNILDICPICKSACDDDPNKCLIELKKKLHRDKLIEMRKKLIQDGKNEKKNQAENPSTARKCPICNYPCNDPDNCVANLEKRLREEAREAAKYCRPTIAIVCPVCKMDADHDTKTCLQNSKKKAREEKKCPVIIEDATQISNEKDTSISSETESSPKICPVCKSICENDNKKCLENLKNKINLGDYENLKDDTQFSSTQNENDDDDFECTKTESASPREPVSKCKSTEKCELDKYDLGRVKTEKEGTMSSEPPSFRNREICAICKSFCDGDVEVCLVEAERLKCTEACLEQIQALRREIEMLSAQEAASEERINKAARSTCGKNPAECIKSTGQRKQKNDNTNDPLKDISSMSDTSESEKRNEKSTCTQNSSTNKTKRTKKETSPANKKETQSKNEPGETTEARKKQGKKDPKGNERCSGTSSETSVSERSVPKTPSVKGKSKEDCLKQIQKLEETLKMIQQTRKYPRKFKRENKKSGSLSGGDNNPKKIKQNQGDREAEIFGSSPRAEKLCPVCKSVCSKSPRYCLASLEKKLIEKEIDSKKYGKTWAGWLKLLCPVCHKICGNDPKKCLKELKQMMKDEKQQSSKRSKSKKQNQFKSIPKSYPVYQFICETNQDASDAKDQRSARQFCSVCKAYCGNNPKKCLKELEKKMNEEEREAKKRSKSSASRLSLSDVCPVCNLVCGNDPEICLATIKEKQMKDNHNQSSPRQLCPVCKLYCGNDPKNCLKELEIRLKEEEREKNGSKSNTSRSSTSNLCPVCNLSCDNDPEICLAKLKEKQTESNHEQSSTLQFCLVCKSYCGNDPKECLKELEKKIKEEHETKKSGKTSNRRSSMFDVCPICNLICGNDPAVCLAKMIKTRMNDDFHQSSTRKICSVCNTRCDNLETCLTNLEKQLKQNESTAKIRSKSCDSNLKLAQTRNYQSDTETERQKSKKILRASSEFGITNDNDKCAQECLIRIQQLKQQIACFKQKSSNSVKTEKNVECRRSVRQSVEFNQEIVMIKYCANDQQICPALKKEQYASSPGNSTAKLYPICKIQRSKSSEYNLETVEKKMKENEADSKNCAKLCAGRPTPLCPVCNKVCENDPKKCFEALKLRIRDEKNKPSNRRVSSSRASPLCSVCKKICDNNPQNCFKECKRRIEEEERDATKGNKSSSSRGSMSDYQDSPRQYSDLDQQTTQFSASPSRQTSAPVICVICKSICKKSPKYCLAMLIKKLKEEEIEAKKCSKSCKGQSSLVCPICKKKCDNDPKICLQDLIKKVDQAELEFQKPAKSEKLCPVCNTICGNDPRKCLDRLEKKITEDAIKPKQRSNQTSALCPVCKKICDNDPMNCFKNLKQKFEQEDARRRQKLCPVCNTICGNDPKKCFDKLEKKIMEDAIETKKCSKFCVNRASVLCPICKKVCDNDPINCFKTMKKKFEQKNTTSEKCPVCNTICGNDPRKCLERLEKKITEDIISTRKFTNRASSFCPVCKKVCDNDPMNCFKQLKKKFEQDKARSDKLCPVCKTICDNDPRKCLDRLEKKITEGTVKASKGSNQTSALCPVCKKICDNDPMHCFKNLKNKFQQQGARCDKLCPVCNKTCENDPNQCLDNLEKKITEGTVKATKGSNQTSALCPVCKKICDNDPMNCFKNLKKKFEQEEIEAKKRATSGSSQSSSPDSKCFSICGNKSQISPRPKKYNRDLTESKRSYSNKYSKLDVHSQNANSSAKQNKTTGAPDLCPVCKAVCNKDPKSCLAALEKTQTNYPNSSKEKEQKTFPIGLQKMEECAQTCLEQIQNLRKQILNVDQQLKTSPRSEENVSESDQCVVSCLEKIKQLQNEIDICNTNTKAAIRNIEQIDYSEKPRLYAESSKIPVPITKVNPLDAEESHETVQKNKTGQGLCPVCKSNCASNPEDCIAAAEKIKVEKLQAKNPSTLSVRQSISRDKSLPRTSSELVKCNEECLQRIQKLEEEIRVLQQASPTARRQSTSSSTILAKDTGNVTSRSEPINNKEVSDILPNKDINRNKFSEKKYKQTDEKYCKKSISSQTHTADSSKSKSSSDLCTSKTKCPCYINTKTSEPNSKSPSPKIKKEHFCPNCPNRRPLSEIIKGTKSEITIKNKEKDNADDRKENRTNKEYSNKENSKNKTIDSVRQTPLSDNEKRSQRCVQIKPNCPNCNALTITESNSYECPNCSHSRQIFNEQESKVSIRKNKKTPQTQNYSDGSYSSNSESMLVVNYRSTTTQNNEEYPSNQDDKEWNIQPSYSVTCEENSLDEVEDEDASKYKSLKENLLISENSIAKRIDKNQNDIDKESNVPTTQEQDSSMRIIGESRVQLYNNDASIKKPEIIFSIRRNACSRRISDHFINPSRIKSLIQNRDSSNKQSHETGYYNQELSTNIDPSEKERAQALNDNQSDVFDSSTEIAENEEIIEQAESIKSSQSKRKRSRQQAPDSFKRLKNLPEIRDPKIRSNTGEQRQERAKSPCIPALRTSDSGHRQALSLLRDLYVATKPLHEAMRCGVPPEETLGIIRELTYKERVKQIKPENSGSESQRSLSLDRKTEDKCPEYQHTDTKSSDIDVEENRKELSVSGKQNTDFGTSERSDRKRTNNKSDKLKPKKSIPNIYVMAHSETDIRAALSSSPDTDQFANTQVSTEETWKCPATQTSPPRTASPKTKQNAEMRTVYLQSYDNPFDRQVCNDREADNRLLKVQPYAYNPRKNGLESARSDDNNDQEPWTKDQQQRTSTPSALFALESPFPVRLSYGGPPDCNRPKSTSPTIIGPCEPNQKISCCKKHGIRYKSTSANQSPPQSPQEARCSKIYDNNDEDWDQMNKSSNSLSPKYRPNRKY